MPINPRERPTEKEFQDFLGYQERIWADALSVWKEADGFYWGTASIWADFYKRNPNVQQNRPEYTSGLFRAKVDAAVRQLSFEPQYSRLELGEGATEKERTGRVENAVRAIVLDAFSNATQFPVMVTGKQMSLYAYHNIGTLVDDNMGLPLEKPTKRGGGEKSEDFERRQWEWALAQERWNPISIETPVPGEVLMDPFEENPPLSIRKRTLPAYKLALLLMERRRRYSARGVWEDKRYRTAFVRDFGYEDAYDEHTIIEWWSPYWHGLFPQAGKSFGNSREALYWEPNITGIQPFRHRWVGDAIHPVGQAFDLKYWAQQALMDKVKDVIRASEQVDASIQNLVMRHAWARLGFEGDAAEFADMLQAGLLVGKKDDFFIEPIPPMPASAFQQQQALHDSVDEGTFRPMVGERQPSTMTASEALLRAENTQRTFRAHKASAEEIFGGQASDVLKIAYRLNQEGGDSFKSLGQGKDKLLISDLGNPPQFHMKCSFEQVDPVAFAQDKKDILELYGQGLASSAMVYKVWRIEDPAGVRKAIYEDRMWEDPDLAEQGVVNAMLEAGEFEVAQRRLVALNERKRQRVAQQMAGGGQGVGGGSVGGQQNRQPPAPIGMGGNGNNPVAGGQ